MSDPAVSIPRLKLANLSQHPPMAKTAATKKRKKKKKTATQRALHTSVDAKLQQPVDAQTQKKKHRPRSFATTAKPDFSDRLPPPSSATSAPTGGRERAHTTMPVCPNCGHRRAVQRSCYWDAYDEWVYSCGHQGPVSEPVVQTAAQYRNHLQNLVDRQFGIEAEERAPKELPVAVARSVTLAIMPPLALTYTGNELKDYFCGYRWRAGRKVALCENCLDCMLVDLDAGNPVYRCKQCDPPDTYRYH
jgi:hypothetical protein